MFYMVSSERVSRDAQGSTDPLAVVRAFYEALGQGRLEFSLIASDIRWRTPATLPWNLKRQPEPDGSIEYRGLEELGEYLQAAVEAVDGMVALAETFIAGVDRVVVLGRECGTARQTGKPFDAPFAHVLRVERGRITELRGHIDTLLLAQAFEGPSG